ncbi:MAG: hypothetical protein HOO88_07350 [Kiritimatiellaceae bacterium]|nr:hypothetical protein [Kiritimatiellaceae bacterium]
MKKYVVVFGLLLCFSGLAQAAPMRAHVLFSDHMVLQRDMDVPVWGYATVGTVVTVKLDGVTVGTATTDSAGQWMARIGSHPNDGGVSHVLLISAPSETSVQINDVVFGDVYLASGQSNMALLMDTRVGVGPNPYHAAGVTGYADEIIASAAYSKIRQVTVFYSGTSATELKEPQLTESWTNCNPSSISNFTAVGYFFAKNIYLETGAPVGLILSVKGGQVIGGFLNSAGCVKVPQLSGMLQNKEQGGLPDHFKKYNAMIAPLMPYGLRGAIWYQGEANVSDNNLYQHELRALIRGWRQSWGQGDFPFYYVQLPTLSEALGGIPWPGLRQAQFNVLSETNVGMAVNIDASENSLHPANKTDLGYRLAQWALGRDLRRDDRVYSGPLYRSSTVEGAQIRILFDYADTGLMVGWKKGTNSVVPSGTLQNFEIAGTNRAFFSATAVIDKDTVVVSSPSVPAPAYVRYCYAAVPSGTNKLYNSARLTASPFRTDEDYPLFVISGTAASLTNIPGSVVTITADAAPSGKVFDRWIGAASEIDDLNAATAQVTMPSYALYLLATYRDTAASVYTLSVSNGFGSGTSQTNSILNIEAAAPPTGKVFDHWAGNTQTVVDVSAAVTTLRMPASDVSVTAVYRTIDSVGDGVSDVWRTLYFGGDGTTTNSQSAASADPDGDGASNLKEYLDGTSPQDGQSALHIGRTFSGSGGALNFRSVTGYRYRLETTASLTAPSWTTMIYNITGDGLQKQTSFTLGTASNGFYRLRQITE